MSAMSKKTGESPSMLRQRWLETCLVELRGYFAKQGYEVPGDIRISVGWAYGNAEKTAGQCWPPEASSDKHHEIFIAPSQNKDYQIIDTIIHEMVHATVGCKAGHKGPFKECATALGLEGKMTSTHLGPVAMEWADKFVKKHGSYPAGILNRNKRKVQTTRLLKCECESCGYIARVTAKWIEERGEPYCGTKDHGRMKSDFEGDEG